MHHNRSPRLLRSVVAIATAEALALSAGCSRNGPIEENGKMLVKAQSAYTNSYKDQVSRDEFRLITRNKWEMSNLEFERWTEEDADATRVKDLELGIAKFNCEMDSMVVTMVMKDYVATDATEYRINQFNKDTTGQYFVRTDVAPIIVSDAEELVTKAGGINPCIKWSNVFIKE